VLLCDEYSYSSCTQLPLLLLLLLMLLG